jgi:hypothetical protein
VTTTCNNQEDIMHKPSGRHRRPHRSLAARVWALAAAALAAALAYVFVPEEPGRGPAAIAPSPERRALPRARPPSGTDDVGAHPDPDEVGGALVRPYMLPRPRVPEGDLLAPPVTAFPADDLGDLTKAIRAYLDIVG